VRYARQRFGLRVHQGTLEDAHLWPHTFDVVTMWDVLEHLYQPVQTLRHVRRLLRPDGILVVRVPNLDAWDARLFGRYWAGLDQPRHLFVPDTAAMSRLLHQAGFAVVDNCCLSGSYAMLALTWRFWVRQHIISTRGQRVAQWLDNPLTQAALSPFLWLIDTVWKQCPLLTIVAQVKKT
jgi:SAM-dependent methyltransferase